MSIKYARAALSLRDENITPTEKSTLLAICVYADKDDGDCWPSKKTLADDCCLSVRSVQRAIASLVEKGYLKQTNRKAQNGRDKSNILYVSIEALRGDTVSEGRVSECHPHYIEPTKKKEKPPYNSPQTETTKPDSIAARRAKLDNAFSKIQTNPRASKSPRKSKRTSTARVSRAEQVDSVPVENWTLPILAAYHCQRLREFDPSSQRLADSALLNQRQRKNLKDVVVWLTSDKRVEPDATQYAIIDAKSYIDHVFDNWERLSAALKLDGTPMPALLLGFRNTLGPDWRGDKTIGQSFAAGAGRKTESGESGWAIKSTTDVL